MSTHPHHPSINMYKGLKTSTGHGPVNRAPTHAHTHLHLYTHLYICPVILGTSTPANTHVHLGPNPKLHGTRSRAHAHTHTPIHAQVVCYCAGARQGGRGSLHPRTDRGAQALSRNRFLVQGASSLNNRLLSPSRLRGAHGLIVSSGVLHAKKGGVRQRVI